MNVAVLVKAGWKGGGDNAGEEVSLQALGRKSTLDLASA
jgi:hypothetical protein